MHITSNSTGRKTAGHRCAILTHRFSPVNMGVEAVEFLPKQPFLFFF